MNIIQILKEKVPADPEFKEGNTTFLNPYSYLIMRRNTDLLNQFDNIYIDGILLVYFLRIFGVGKTKRNSFDMTTGAPIVYNYAITNNKEICFIGSKKEEVDMAIENIKTLFPKLKIAYHRSGYFSSHKEKMETLQYLKELKPDICVIGMGTPLQERFVLEMKLQGLSSSNFTCGGYLHQTAKKQVYFPEWSNKLNLRWLYRMIKEPAVIKRHLIALPKFCFIFIWDFIKYKR